MQLVQRLLFSIKERPGLCACATLDEISGPRMDEAEHAMEDKGHEEKEDVMVSKEVTKKDSEILSSSELVLRTIDVTPSELRDKTFVDLHCLDDHLLNALQLNGFKTPSPIQWSSLPLSASLGVDCLLQAKSGTGKTLVFALTALNLLNSRLKTLAKSESSMSTLVLILAPTREIAVQIASVLHSMASRALIKVFIGGGLADLEEERKKANQCHIAVATPGRMRHLIQEQVIKVSGVRLFVLDEADRLLESSFLSDVLSIFNALPQHKQVIASSATYSEELVTLAKRLMRKPVLIRPALQSQVLVGVTQVAFQLPYYSSSERLKSSKLSILLKLFESVRYNQCLVFCNYVVGAENVANAVREKGWPAQVATGSQEQQLRLKAYNELKSYKCRILVTTDMMARGIDAEHVDLVVNFDLPSQSSTYLHRIGRGGRYGSTAIAISLATHLDFEQGGKLANIVRDTGSNVFIVNQVTDLKDERLAAMKSDCSKLEKVVASSTSDAPCSDHKSNGNEGEKGFMNLLRAFDEGASAAKGTKKSTNKSHKTDKSKGQRYLPALDKSSVTSEKKRDSKKSRSIKNNNEISQQTSKEKSISAVKEYLESSIIAVDGQSTTIPSAEEVDEEVQLYLQSRECPSSSGLEHKEEDLTFQTTSFANKSSDELKKAAQVVLNSTEKDFQTKVSKARDHLASLNIDEACEEVKKGVELPIHSSSEEPSELGAIKELQTERNLSHGTEEGLDHAATDSERESKLENVWMQRPKKIRDDHIPDFQPPMYTLTTIEPSSEATKLSLPCNPEGLLEDVRKGELSNEWLEIWKSEVEKNKQFIRDMALIQHMTHHNL